MQTLSKLHRFWSESKAGPNSAATVLARTWRIAISITCLPHKTMLVKAAFISALLLPATASDLRSGTQNRPVFDPSELKGPEVGPRNELMVLASPHLSTFSVPAGAVDPIVDRLANWQPTIVATENLSGGQCDSLRRQPIRYQSTVNDYCYDPSAAGAAVKMEVPAAIAETERTLAQWPQTPSPSDRRRLAALFLAAGEPVSAVVQWLRLAPDKRIAADGLTDGLVAELNSRMVRKNESYLIGAALAARLGLERVYSFDDQSAAREVADQAAYGAALTKAWENPATKARIDAHDRFVAALAAPDGLLNMYRALNEPDQPMLTFRSDFGAALEEPSKQAFGRRYLGYWETRNIRMTGNIRDVLAVAPGSRMLVIVGASHKGYLEAYLDQMHDVQLVDPLSVLK